MNTKASLRERLKGVYRCLWECYGPQHWWPGDDTFEMIVGAILTQNTAWVNVEKALSNLREAGFLSPSALRRLPTEEIARLIRPSGYYNAKTQKLKDLVQHLGEKHGDSLDRLFSPDIDELRRELLSIYGIGEETADSIILYGARKPAFVIDAYTKRILGRLGLAPKNQSYSAYQSLFMENLAHEVKLFNEYHALLVRHGKTVCLKTPLCPRCCLKDMCPSSKG
jgi:endonuclease-3 related protein